MRQEELKDNLLSPGQWLRILFMALYLLALWVVGIVLLVVMITQAVTVLVTGTTNAHLRRFGILTTIYLFQIVDFLVYGSEEKPFPFKPFPETRIGRTYPTEPVYPDPREPSDHGHAVSSPPGPQATASEVPSTSSPDPGADVAVPDPYADLDMERGDTGPTDPPRS